MSERPALNTFRTCPASSGETETVVCTVYSDGAHRCAHERTQHKVHACICGRYSWYLRNFATYDQAKQALPD